MFKQPPFTRDNNVIASAMLGGNQKLLKYRITIQHSFNLMQYLTEMHYWKRLVNKHQPIRTNVSMSG